MLRLVLWAVTAVAPIVRGIAAPAPLVTRGVSPRMLQQLSLAAEYSAASYCKNNTNSTETKLTCDTGICPMVEKADTKTLHKFYRNTEIGDVTGFLAADATNRHLVLSLRGTRSIDGIIADLDFPMQDVNELCDGCRAHGGFWKSWKSVAETMQAQIQSAVAYHPGYRLVFAGHSYGGALVTLGATAMRNARYTIDLYTMGCPRVGNQALAEYITAQGTNYRITHTDDVVPKLPPGSWGFSHPAPEYWITSGNYETVTTGDIEVIQGVNSSDGNAGTVGISVSAHLNYFGDIAGCGGVI